MAPIKCTDSGLRELALFAGAGGGILGGHLLGWRTICAVELDPYAAGVLVARQNDGCLPPFPIWDDIRTFDGRPWRGRVDVVSGGFPCQDISAAGGGEGITGERSGLWKEQARIIGEVLPRFALVENSPILTSRGLGTVLGDLAAMGYDAEWGVLGAHHAGAPHKRDRIWIVGRSNATGDESPEKQQRQICQSRGMGKDVADAQGVGGGTSRQEGSESQWADGTGGSGQQYAGIVANPDCLRELQPQGCQRDQRRRTGNGSEDVPDTKDGGRAVRGGAQGQGRHPLRHDMQTEGRIGGRWWKSEPDVGRVADGVAARVDRLRCLGNGQVSSVAAHAFESLSSRLAARSRPSHRSHS